MSSQDKTFKFNDAWIDSVKEGTAKDRKKLISYAVLHRVGSRHILEQLSKADLLSVVQNAINNPDTNSFETRLVKNEYFHTSGDGLFTHNQESVGINALQLRKYTNSFAELCVYTNVEDHVLIEGSIHNDKGFIHDLREYLKYAGYNGTVKYSPWDFHTEDYISFIVNGKFIQSWNNQSNK